MVTDLALRIGIVETGTPLPQISTSLATFLKIATGSGFAGLCQRIFLVALATWFLLKAARLRLYSFALQPWGLFRLD